MEGLASTRLPKWAAPSKICGVLCLSTCLLCGCGRAGQSQQKTENAPAPADQTPQNSKGDTGSHQGSGEADKPVVCNNAASLLYDLLGQEKNVGRLLLIKKKTPAFEKLIKDISKTADDGEKQLDRFARDNPALDLHQKELPPGETAAREAQSKSQEHTLLAAKDQTFEFDLLLAQAQALDYGSHLDGVAAENCTAQGETSQFSAMQMDFSDLYTQVLAQMRALPRVAARRARNNKKAGKP